MKSITPESLVLIVIMAGIIFVLIMIVVIQKSNSNRKDRLLDSANAAWSEEHQRALTAEYISREKDGIIDGQKWQIRFLNWYNAQRYKEITNLKWRLSEAEKELENERAARGTGTDQNLSMGELSDGLAPGIEVAAPYSERRGTEPDCGGEAEGSGR